MSSSPRGDGDDGPLDGSPSNRPDTSSSLSSPSRAPGTASRARAPSPPAQPAPVNAEEEQRSIHGFDVLPPFANMQNKKLNAEVRATEQTAYALDAELAENKERVQIMQDHLKNVQQQHLHTQEVVEAKKKELEAEDHLARLAEREIGRLQSDVVKVQKDQKAAQDRLNLNQNQMFKWNEVIEQFKMHLPWNREELLQWSLAAKQKEEDMMALMQYHGEDANKIKKLILHNEKVARQLQEAKAALDAEETHTRAYQIELDKLSEEFKKAHDQRRALLQQWQDVSTAIVKRDEVILQTGERIAEARAHARDVEAQATKQRLFLQNQQQENKSLQLKTQHAERTIEKKRDDLYQKRHEAELLQDETATVRNSLEKVYSELRAAKNMNENLQQMQEERNARLKDLQAMVDERKQALDDEATNSKTLQERAAQIEALFKQNQDKRLEMDKELAAMKDAMFRYSHELFQLRKGEADLIAEISGAQSTSRNLQARIHELDQRSLKQQEMLYNIEFQVQQLERKVAFASGKRSLEETIALKEQISQLQKNLDEVQAQYNMMNTQVKRLQDDLRAAKREWDRVTAEREQLGEKIAAIELENETSLLDVQATVAKKEEAIVQHDVIKLEVKRLRDLLTQRADQVFSLQARKMELAKGMQIRETEIQLDKDIKRAQIKAAEESRHKLAMEEKERLITLDKLKKKYETIASRIIKHDEEEKSQAYYIIQAAQEREELQREGDDLHRQILQSQTEIEKMTRTLDFLNERNSVARGQFRKADGSQEEQQLQDVEKQHRAMTEKVYKGRNDLRELQEDMRERESILQNLDREIERTRQTIVNKQEELVRLKQEASDTAGEVQRADQQLDAAIQAYRDTKGLGDGQQGPEETQLLLQEQQRKTQVLYSLIQGFAEDHPDIKDAVSDYFQELGVKPEAMSTAPLTSPLPVRKAKQGTREETKEADTESTPSLSGRRSKPATGRRAAGDRDRESVGSVSRPESRQSNGRPISSRSTRGPVVGNANLMGIIGNGASGMPASFAPSASGSRPSSRGGGVVLPPVTPPPQGGARSSGNGSNGSRPSSSGSRPGTGRTSAFANAGAAAVSGSTSGRGTPKHGRVPSGGGASARSISSASSQSGSGAQRGSGRTSGANQPLGGLGLVGSSLKLS